MQLNKTRVYHGVMCNVLIFFAVLFAYSENINFSAKKMQGSIAENKEYSSLIGEALVTTESLELRADKITLNGKNYRYIIAEGNITGTYTEENFTFTCEILQYDRKTQIAVLEKSVSMIDNTNNVSLKAEYIMYNQKTEIANIQVGVLIKKDDALCTSAFALYRKKTQVAELRGNAKVLQEDNEFEAEEIIFNLETEEMTLDGRVQGNVSEKAEETTSENLQESSQENKSDSNTPKDKDNPNEEKPALQSRLFPKNMKNQRIKQVRYNHSQYYFKNDRVNL